MLKKLSWLFIVLFTAIGMSGCGDDNDEPDNPDSGNSSELVGIWDVMKVTTKYYTYIPEMKDTYNREEVEGPDGSYWEFTSRTLTMHDPNDLLDGKALKYKYDESEDELDVEGFFTYDVKKLTKSSLILVFDTSDERFGQTVTIEFEKR